MQQMMMAILYIHVLAAVWVVPAAAHALPHSLKKAHPQSQAETNWGSPHSEMECLVSKNLLTIVT